MVTDFHISFTFTRTFLEEPSFSVVQQPLWDHVPQPSWNPGPLALLDPFSSISLELKFYYKYLLFNVSTILPRTSLEETSFCMVQQPM